MRTLPFLNRVPVGGLNQRVSFTVAWCYAMLCWAGTLHAAPISEFGDPDEMPGNLFGRYVVTLSTGNVVVASPWDDVGGTEAGAVYLFNGATGALISTLRGSSAGDNIGSGGVTALADGNYVIISPLWDNGGASDVGAVTWGSGATGVSGVVSAANSLVGSAAGDNVGSAGVTGLTSGSYVVVSPLWNNGGIADAGAVTFGPDGLGVTGTVSAANSLVGSAASDAVGNTGVTALPNGRYVVVSPLWNNGGIADAGAVTWGPEAGVTGPVSVANSLVGSAANDQVGFSGVTLLTNGNYLVRSPLWNNGGIADAGAVTWGSGTTGVSGVVSATNSLFGPAAADQVGSGGVTALSNGNYVVASPLWNNGATTDVGAVTWRNGTTGVSGAVSAANSLIGSTAGDNVGNPGVTALTSGNYVVRSANWDNGAVANAGAVTWVSGAVATNGVISSGNSLVGSTAGDNVGSGGVTALTNGNYVVRSPNWDNGAVANAGAVTWGPDGLGVPGPVSAANSLVGSTASDQVGSGGVTALTNGNYVVRSPSWDNGGVVNAGAATWRNGTTGVSGTVSAANSLVGCTSGDQVGSGAFGVTALSNGNYVVVSPLWDNGAITNAGAATWCSGPGPYPLGCLSAANSVVGSAAGDQVGSGGVKALDNGNFVVVSPLWDNGGAADAGAATWVGTMPRGPDPDTVMVTGPVSAANSLVGTLAGSGLGPIVVDNVNYTFIAPFITESGGRVRVGSQDVVTIASLVDIPGDQGGWLRLTFYRFALDAANSSPVVASYGVWRHIPGTMLASAGVAHPAKVDDEAGLDGSADSGLRTAIPAGLEAREIDGRFYVTGRGGEGPGVADAFPPGTWEVVARVQGLQMSQYVAAIPTISNAAPNDFVVTAQTTTPWIWFVSDPVSGQSVDNLAPAMPAQLNASYSAGQTNLQWTPNTENDLASYRVYRGTSADFTPTAQNRIASPTSPSFGDPGNAGSFYKVSAVDVNDNESGFALIGPDQTTAVDRGSRVAFALDGVRPNPASADGIRVTFALPTGASARLDLLDLSGRRVAEREVGSLGAGRHTVDLSETRRVAPGLYWLRLTQGPNRQTRRLVVRR